METIKVIVAGGRDFEDYELLSQKCNDLLINQPNVEIVSGVAKGADTLGAKWAKENHHDLKEFPAQWNKYGKSAGYRRNYEMSQYADALIAFWDGTSRGTSHMIQSMRAKGLKVRIVRY